MKTATIVKNWVIDTTPKILENIHQNNVNIAIYNREIHILEKEINSLIKRDIKFKSCGNINAILNDITEVIKRDKHDMILQDIKHLLHLFEEITSAKNFKLLLGTINTNMCKRFHADNNDLRMLCTYSGPGTLWLTEDNINRKALDTYGDNASIVIDKSSIEQAKTGAVVILKGAKYLKVTNPAVHRSPAIEENGEKRLLLRIDIS